MPENGVKTISLPAISQIDSVIGNRDGSTGLIPFANLAAQVRGNVGPSYETVAELNADLDWPSGSLGIVYGEGDETDGLYQKAGASGAGYWSRIGAHQLNLIIDGAQSAQTAAAASAAAALASEGNASDSADAAASSETAAMAAAEASGNVLFYDDKADANTALGGLSEGQIVEVLADESLGGLRTRYRVESAAFVFKVALTSRGLELADVDTVLTDTALTYASGLIAEGDIVYARKEGYSYRAAASGASDQRVTSAGGAKYYVQPVNGALESAAFGVTGTGAETTKLATALAAAAGGTLFINKPAGGALTTNSLVPAANTTIVVQQGTTINIVASGSRCFQIQQPHVHIWAYGAKVVADGTQDSHPIYINAGGANHPKHCSIRGLEVVGAGNTGDDCFYIGGDPANNLVPEDISIIDCIANGNAVARNCMSIVAVNGLLVDNFEAYGAGTSPGLGIDVEANRFMADGTSAVRNVVINRPHVHDNPNNSGIGIIFGSEITILEPNVYGNGSSTGEIVTDAGGAQFDSGVYRKGDKLAVSAIDTVNGWLTVTDGLAGNLLTDDLQIYEGMIVNRQTIGGGAWPTEYTLNRYEIVEIDATQSKVKLGFSKGRPPIIPTTTGSGTLTTDPETSELGMNVNGRPGNNDKITIRGGHVRRTGSGNLISISQSRDVLIEGVHGVTAVTGLTLPYSSRVTARNNTLRQTDGGSGRGLVAGGGSGLSTSGNRIENFSLEGFRLDGASKTQCGPDEFTNCGHTGNYVYRIYNAKGGRFWASFRADVNHVANVGAQFEASSVNCIATINAEGVGSSNANSLAGGTGTVWRDSIQLDGTFK